MKKKIAGGMKTARVAYKSEPVLKTHKYVVAISAPSQKDVKKIAAAGGELSDDAKSVLHYCANREEVRALKSCREKFPVGAVMDVFAAEASFVYGWYREA